MKSKKLLQSTLWLTGVSLLSRVLYYIYQVCLTRFVGTELLGLIHIIMPVYYTALSFLTAGFGQAICKLTAEHWSKHSFQSLASVYSGVNRLFLTGFTALLPLLCTLILFFSLRNQIHPLPHLILLPLLLFCTAQEIFHKQHFYGIGNLTVPSALQITEQLVRMSTILCLLSCLPHQTPDSVLIILFFGMLVSEIYSSTHLYVLRKTTVLSVPLSQLQYRSPQNANRRQILQIAVPVSITTVIGQSIGTLNSAILPHLLILSGMSRADALSGYGVLTGMTLPLLSLPCSLTGSLSIILLPCLSGSRARGNYAAFTYHLRYSVRLTLLLVAPLTLILASFSSTIGHLLYNQNSIGTFALPLAACLILSAFEDLFATALNACDRQTFNTLITFLSALLQIVTTIHCTPSMGMSGYVLALLLSALSGTLFRLIALLRTYRTFPNS